PPTIVAPNDVNVPGGAPAGPYAFSLTDDTGVCNFSAESSNNAVVPEGSFTFGGTCAAPTVSFTPNDVDGAAVLTLAVSDTRNMPRHDTFTVNVTASSGNIAPV